MMNGNLIFNKKGQLTPIIIIDPQTKKVVGMKVGYFSANQINDIMNSKFGN